MGGTDGQTERQADMGTEQVQQELCREDKAQTLTAVTILTDATASLLQSFTKAAKPYKSLRFPRHFPHSVTLYTDTVLFIL